jgi:hypothetical protein
MPGVHHWRKMRPDPGQPPLISFHRARARARRVSNRTRCTAFVIIASDFRELWHCDYSQEAEFRIYSPNGGLAIRHWGAPQWVRLGSRARIGSRLPVSWQR